MQTTSMTALVSAFVRAYHSTRDGGEVFDDPLARSLLTGEEYEGISRQMAGGVKFFQPGFQGTGEEALDLIVRRHLAPSPLGRAAFAESALANAAALGAEQYLILGAGYDTFAYRQPAWAEGLSIFEVDRPAALEEKRARLERAGVTPPDNVFFVGADLSQADWGRKLEEHPAFSRKKISFCSLLGLVYYLSVPDFAALLDTLKELLPRGSALAFDYPAAGGAPSRQALLAGAAGEAMRADYDPMALEKLLSDHGFLAYEHLAPSEITRRFFEGWNLAHPERPMEAQPGVNYCLAVRQGS